MKYLISIAYDGSKFNGLQKLNKKITVQGELEKALTKMNEKPVSVKSSGRTDKGVHANNQKCHFEIQKDTNPYKLRYYINNATSPYIYVKTCEVVEDENFHARFSVKSKTYYYLINTNEYDPIINDYQYNLNHPLNIELIKKASQLFIGEHNYKAFVTGKNETYNSAIEKIDIENNKGIIKITIKGKAFYTYMVRNIIEILILVGEEKLKIEVVDKMLKTGDKFIEYGPAPACGLYLDKVEY